MWPQFVYHGESLPWFDHLYNLTMLNERAVELAVAQHWFDSFEHDPCAGLEVGNVLSHYGERCHAVLDRFEQPAWHQEGQDYLPLDVFDLAGGGEGNEHVASMTWPWIISISTLEHVGEHYPYRPEDSLGALRLLTQRLDPGGRLLVTFPTGVNSALDEYVAAGAHGFDRVCTMVRSDSNNWEQTPEPVIREYAQWAQSVFVGEWVRGA